MVTLQEARKVIGAAEKKAIEIGQPMNIAVVDEGGNLIQPGSFLPAAERYNLMPTIDRWVVSTVFARYHALVAERGGGPLTCALNLSGTSLNAEDFLEFIREQVAKHELPPHSICFEVTETSVVANLDHAQRFIAGFKHNMWLIALQGLTPIPYKIVTISAGIAGVNFWWFTAFSAVTRSVRFVGEAILFYFFGDTAKHYLEKYLTPVLIAFFTLIVAGFVALHYLFK